MRQPMVLGHEVVGTVSALGPGVAGPDPGTQVAVHPATTCGRCPGCRAGRRNICADVRYLGPVFGRRVLVTGAGPIGCLVAAAARAAGATEVLVTDLVAEPLEIAATMGATHTFLATADAGDAVDVDVAIEVSGSPTALATAAGAVRRGGRLVMLGMLPPGAVAFPANLVITRELDVRGAFRFDTEFTEALRLLAGGLSVRPLVTGVVPLAEAAEGFALAADRRRSGKILLDLTG